MLTVNPKKRVTAKDILTHPWIQGAQSERPLGEEFVQNLQLTDARSRLRFVVRTVIAVNRFVRVLDKSVDTKKVTENAKAKAKVAVKEKEKKKSKKKKSEKDNSDPPSTSKPKSKSQSKSKSRAVKKDRDESDSCGSDSDKSSDMESSSPSPSSSSSSSSSSYSDSDDSEPSIQRPSKSVSSLRERNEEVVLRDDADDLTLETQTPMRKERKEISDSGLQREREIENEEKNEGEREKEESKTKKKKSKVTKKKKRVAKK